MDLLEKKLVTIENKLGGAEEPTPDVIDKLGWHLDKIEDLIEGGSGGTSDYNDLENKPSIAGNTLEGDLSLEDLGVQSALSEDDIEGSTAMLSILFLKASDCCACASCCWYSHSFCFQA